jgi:hypothetical protein
MKISKALDPALEAARDDNYTNEPNNANNANDKINPT